MPPQVTQDPPTLEDLSSPPSEPVIPATPPTPLIASPPPPPTDDGRYTKLLEGTIAEQNRKIADLERSRAAAPPVTAAPAPKTKDELRQEFYDNPIAASRAVIREELEATVGPLRTFVESLQGASAVDKLVNQFKINPRFKAHWSPELEGYVRAQAEGVRPENLNDNSFGFIVVSAIGLKTAGMLEGSPSALAADVSPSPPSPPMPPTPPYMRPSAPAGPGAPPSPAARALNENEKRMLREYNSGKSADKQMTEAQYVKWQEMPGEDVANASFDRPTPK